MSIFGPHQPPTGHIAHQSPRDQRSWLQRITDPVLGGLSWAVENTFDKAYRPVAAGLKILGKEAGVYDEGADPWELAAWVPASDALGITDFGSRVGEKELLGGWDDPDSYWDDIAALGVGVAADPTSWVTLGGTKVLSSGGKALKNSGYLDDVLSAAARQGKAGVNPKSLGIGTGASGLVDNLGGYQPRATGMQFTVDEAISAYKQQLARNTADPSILRQQLEKFDNTFLDSLYRLPEVKGKGDLSGILDQRISSLFNAPVVGPIGSGRLSQAIAKTGAGTADLTGRLSRPLRQYFDSKLAPRIPGKIWNIRGPKTKYGQRTFQTMLKAADDLVAQNDMALSVINQKFVESGLLTGSNKHNVGMAMRGYLEAKDPIAATTSLAQSSPNVHKTFVDAGIYQDLDALKDLQKQAYALADSSGLPAPILDDLKIEHFHRQFDNRYMSDNALGDLAGNASLSPDRGVATSASLGRKEELANIPGGTEALMRLSLDKRFSGIATRSQANTGNIMQAASGKSFLDPTLKNNLIDEILKDPDYSQTIVKTHRRDPAGNLVALDLSNPLDVAYQREQIGNLLDTVGSLSTRYADENIPMYRVDPVKDTRDYINSVTKAIKSTEVIYETIGDLAKTKRQWADLGLSGPSVTNVIDLLQRSGDEGLRLSADNVITDNALRHVVKQLQSSGMQLPIPAGATKEQIIDVLQGSGNIENAIAIPTTIADDMGRAFAVYTNPRYAAENTSAIARIYDSLNDSWKVGMTSLFTAFHLRNGISGGWTNFVGGIFSPWGMKSASNMSRKNVVQGASEIYFDATSHNYPPELAQFIVNGRVVVPAGADVSFLNIPAGQSAADAVATQILMYEVPAYKVWSADISPIDLAVDSETPELFLRESRMLDGSTSPAGRRGLGEQAGAALSDAAKVATSSPAAGVVTGLDILGQVTGVGSPLGALTGRGAFGGRRGILRSGKLDPNTLLTKPEVDTSAIYSLGHKAGSEVEFMNRVSGYLTARKKGMSPTEAAAAVGRAQIDYSLLTEFEKKVMRRIIPFYSFTRGMLPTILEDFVTKPGGARALLAKATHTLQNQDQEYQYATPEWIRSGNYVPMGRGIQNVMAQLGQTDAKIGHPGYMKIEVPMSDLNELLPRGGTASDYVDMLLNRASPMFKAGYETITGKEVKSGRPLWSVSRGQQGIIPGTGRSYRDVFIGKDGELKDYYLPRALGFTMQDVDSAQQRNTVWRELLKPELEARQEVDPITGRTMPVFKPNPGYYYSGDQLLNVPGYYGSPRHQRDQLLKTMSDETRYFKY